MTEDRLPPHDARAEAAILGAAIWDPERAAGLRLAWFYLPEHQAVCRAVMALQASGRPIDVGFVAQALPGGPTADWCAAIARCVDACHSPHNWSYWAEDLTRCAALRRLLSDGTLVASGAFEPGADASALAAQLSATARAVSDSVAPPPAGTVKSACLEVINDLDSEHSGTSVQHIPTGLVDLDRLVRGFLPQQFWVMGSRPSVGKTSLALCIAINAARAGNRVLFVSLEMSVKELIRRAAVIISGSPISTGSNRSMSKISAAMEIIVGLPLEIDDRGGLTLEAIDARIKAACAAGTRLAVVDYIGLVGCTARTNSLFERVSMVSNGLKRMAKQHNVALLALSQLNRESAKDGRAPLMSELRQSGDIEQDADVILLLHREPDQDGQEFQRVRCNVAKQRNGPIGGVDLLFLAELTRFESASNIDPSDIPRSYMKD